MRRTLTHYLDHAICGLAVFGAGRAATKRNQHLMLATAAVAFVRCHLHHHGAER